MIYRLLLFTAITYSILCLLSCETENTDIKPNIHSDTAYIDTEIFNVLDFRDLRKKWIYYCETFGGSAAIAYDTMYTESITTGLYPSGILIYNWQSVVEMMVAKIYHSHPAFEYHADSVSRQLFTYRSDRLSAFAGSPESVDYFNLGAAWGASLESINWGLVAEMSSTYSDSVEFVLEATSYTAYHREAVYNGDEITEIWIIPGIGISEITLKDGSHWRLVQVIN